MKLDDFHIGKIIKEIALLKKISSRKITEAIYRYKNNAHKIYQLRDMDIEDVVRISYLLEYNILQVVSEKFLRHIPYDHKADAKDEDGWLKIDLKSLCVTSNNSLNSLEFLKKIHIGQFIREVARKKDISGNSLSEQLKCTPSAISELFQSKSLKIKTLLQISEVMNINIIALIYISQMNFFISFNIFYNTVLFLNPQNIIVKKTDDATFEMNFLRNKEQKQKHI
jgi:transcriptional regulator with XRE-family HTH domain